MGTKNFNLIDTFISWMRFRRVLPHLSPDDTVLDFGCGYQVYLLDHVKGRIKKGVGLDYDVETKKIGTNIQTRNFKFSNRLPFTNYTFNVIFMLAVIEHIEVSKVPKLIREMRRILKPGGRIVLTTPTRRGKLILEFLAFKLSVISKEEVGDHKKYYDKKDIDTFCKNYGLTLKTYRTFWFGLNSFVVIEKV